MTNEKKPSIYDDRGTIGSSEELDKYGVWVKSDPQIFSSSGKGDDLSGDISDADDLDLAIPEIEDLPDFSIPESEDSSSDEIDFGDSLESEESNETGEFADISGEDFDLSDTDAESTDFENFDLTDMDSADSLESEESAEPREFEGLEELPEDDEENKDGNVFNFGDLTGQFDSLEDENAVAKDDELPDLEIPSIPEDIELIETEVGENSADSGNSGFTEETPEDVFEETPDTESEELEDTRIDLAAPEPSESVREREKGDEKESNSSSDLSTQLLMKIAEELSSIRTELSTLKKEFSGIKAAVPPSPKEADDDFFNEEDEKISLTGQELINIMNTADFTQEAGVDATEALSEDSPKEEAENQDIEINLDDIGLDEGDSEIKLEDSSELLPPETDAFDEGTDDFDISLEDDTFPEEDIFAEPDSGHLLIDTVFNETENSHVILSNMPGALTGLKLDTEPLEPEPADLAVEEETEKQEAGEDSAFEDSGESFPDFMEEDDELKQLRENGAEPMTSAPSPEDAEYLAENSLAESIDLSGAVIEEPDLSLDIQENPLEEPSFEDISIDLDLTELEGGEAETADDEDTEALGFEDISDTVDSDELVVPVEEESELPGEEISLSVETEEDLAESLDLPDFADSDEPFVPVEEEPELPGEEISLSVETEEDLAESLDSPDFTDFGESDIFDTEENEPDQSGFPKVEPLETENGEVSEEGGDLALIPEKFVVESADSDKPQTPLEETEEIPSVPPSASSKTSESADIPSHLKQELKTVLSYMDQLLESLPDEKIEEFARSEYYDSYKKLFKELGLV